MAYTKAIFTKTSDMGKELKFMRKTQVFLCLVSTEMRKSHHLLILKIILIVGTQDRTFGTHSHIANVTSFSRSLKCVSKLLQQ